MWKKQQELAELRRQERIGDLLLLLQHDHVYTNGWRGDRSNLLADDATLSRIGAAYHVVERGGDITYHGPGQLVAYPILNLRGVASGVRDYIARLETVVIRTLATFGIEARTIPGLIGVWVDDAKIAAVGVKVRRGITYHGFALNVDPNLDYFSHIIPCGLERASVTSMSSILHRGITVDEVQPVCRAAFADVFGLDLRSGRLPG
ncbi:MAG: lipoyl(octanoyl) transferase LipB [Thermomicrobiales bacterium]